LAAELLCVVHSPELKILVIFGHNTGATVATFAIAALPGFVPFKAAAQDRETVTPAFQKAISNIPG